MPGIIKESDGVTLFVTEKCNSNCIMCPMSLASRKRGLSVSQNEWSEMVEQIPSDVMHITITGGEPFLEYAYLLPVMDQINKKFPFAEVLVLTNGRALSVQKLFDHLRSLVTEQYCFAIPIHASNPDLHDRITQTPGSFRQAIKGIRNLSAIGARIEVRIVGHRQNLDDLNNAFHMLVDTGAKIQVINLIAMEMMGCAAANRDSLWVDYDKLAESAEEGIRYAMLHGVDVGLYNFPLCKLPTQMWPLARLSITPSKIRFYDECKECREYHACGGLFYSTYELNLCHVRPIEGSDHK